MLNTPEPATIARNGAGVHLHSEPAPDPGTGEADRAEDRPRLRLKPSGPHTGRVDGVWWPRSDDLAAEVPGLLAAVGDRLGRVETVTYPLRAWGTVPRRITVDGARLRLGGYQWQPGHTIDLVAARGQLTLLVVPPGGTADDAERAFAAVHDDDGDRTVEELLG